MTNQLLRRNDRTRTYDLMVPNHALSQTELHSEKPVFVVQRPDSVITHGNTVKYCIQGSNLSFLSPDIMSIHSDIQTDERFFHGNLCSIKNCDVLLRQML